MGTTDALYTSLPGDAGYPANALAFNLLHNAHVTRKGLAAPYIDQKRANLPIDGDVPLSGSTTALSVLGVDDQDASLIVIFAAYRFILNKSKLTNQDACPVLADFMQFGWMPAR